jgi:dissimilatory sulfite reductase (desulfoviridin) alpha/beta subunit
MSRSYRKHLIIGIGGRSEKKDKRIANRILRRSVKELLHANPEEEIFPIMDEVSDKWSMNKDGKTYFGDLLKHKSSLFPNDSRENDPYWIKVYRKLKTK